jgi:hypothetical protein
MNFKNIITKKEAKQINWFRSIREACKESRLCKNHYEHLKWKEEEAWQAGDKVKAKFIREEAWQFVLNIMCELRDILITEQDCDFCPDPKPEQGRRRSGELNILHKDWDLPRRYRYKDSLLFTLDGDTLVRNLHLQSVEQCQ